MSTKEYYNILPMKSPAPSPTTSVDSGVPVDDQLSGQTAPQRPPRARDDPPEHAYHNLPPYPDHDYQNDAQILGSRRRAITPPPRLPKRQPMMSRPRTPPPPSRRPLNGIMNVYNNSIVNPSSHSNHYSSPRMSSVSSVASTATTSNTCRPFRQRFQVKKRRVGGQCGCKAPSDDQVAMGRDDVILLYSRHCSGSIEWANYLNKLYTELSKHKGKLRVRHLPLEDVSEPVLPAFVEDEIYHSRLQIVLLSPTFLDFAFRQPSVMVGRLLNPDRVLAIMLGVKDSAINIEHRTFLVSFSQWVHLEAKDHNLEFVQTVLYFSTQILQKSVNKPSGQRVQKQCQQQKTFNGRLESNFFHIHPRRATESHNRIVIIFESPQTQRSQFLVSLERSQFGLADVILEDVNLKNPYNLQVTIPSCCFPSSHLAGIRLEIDGINKGFRTLKLESTMSELDQILKGIQDPVEFMCQSIGLGSSCKDKLDERLTREFLFNTPRGFQLLKNADLALLEKYPDAVKDFNEFPTLLHFAAFHGFERLTTVLLECPGAKESSALRNASDLNPTELAQINGHINLARQLHAFQIGVMNSNHIYDYIFQARKSQSPQKPVDPCPYQIPPPPRPVLKEKPESIRNAKPKEDSEIKETKKVSPVQDPFGTFRASGRGGVRKLITTRNRKNNIKSEPSQDYSSGDDDVFHESPTRPEDPFGTMKAANQVVKRPQQSPSSKPPMDDYRLTLPKNQRLDAFNSQNSNNNEEVTLADELLKLLDDFQKNSYSTKEMEDMFENWKKKAQINLKELSPEQDSKLSIDPQKVKGHKALHSLLKLFNGKSLSDALKKEPKTMPMSMTTAKPNTTFNFKKFSTSSRKDLKDDIPSDAVSIKSSEIPDAKAMPGNETIIEAEISILDEESMNVIAFPPTPAKTPISFPPERDDGISTQILPLSRLSLSGSNCSSTPQSNLGSPPKASDNSTMSDKDEPTSRPGSRMMEKLKKSLTEPLIHYFHELNAGSDLEEPEVLNTPKSLAPLSSSLNSSNSSSSSSSSQLSNLKRRSRNLFQIKKDFMEGTTNEADEVTKEDTIDECIKEKKLPPPIITDM